MDFGVIFKVRAVAERNSARNGRIIANASARVMYFADTVRKCVVNSLVQKFCRHKIWEFSVMSAKGLASAYATVVFKNQRRNNCSCKTKKVFHLQLFYFYRHRAVIALAVLSVAMSLNWAQPKPCERCVGNKVTSKQPDLVKLFLRCPLFIASARTLSSCRFL